MISWPRGHGAPANLVTVRRRDSQVNRFGAKLITVSLPALNCAGGRIGALCHASTSHATGHGAWSKGPSKAGAICGGPLGCRPGGGEGCRGCACSSIENWLGGIKTGRACIYGRDTPDPSEEPDLLRVPALLVGSSARRREEPPNEPN